MLRRPEVWSTASFSAKTVSDLLQWRNTDQPRQVSPARVRLTPVVGPACLPQATADPGLWMHPAADILHVLQACSIDTGASTFVCGYAARLVYHCLKRGGSDAMRKLAR
jgi:hypothetical protein